MQWELLAAELLVGMDSLVKVLFELWGWVYD
jgi:hypothetical protein